MDSNPVERIATLIPVEGADRKKKTKKSQSMVLKGYQAVLHVGIYLNELELNYIPEMADQDAPECPTLVEIHGMLAIVQAILSDQFITPNRAVVFNALHDRSNNYWGLKNLSHADRDARAWAAMKFYIEGARARSTLPMAPSLPFVQTIMVSDDFRSKYWLTGSINT